MGQSEQHSQALEQEGQEHGDLLQGGFIDSYRFCFGSCSCSIIDIHRNLTLKHLFGLSWARDQCPGVSWILKTDDDIFVDSLHLPRLLQELAVFPEEHMFLCQVRQLERKKEHQ